MTDRTGISRRALVRAAAATGVTAWTAPAIVASLASPAAALTIPSSAQQCLDYIAFWLRDPNPFPFPAVIPPRPVIIVGANNQYPTQYLCGGYEGITSCVRVCFSVGDVPCFEDGYGAVGTTNIACPDGYISSSINVGNPTTTITINLPPGRVLVDTKVWFGRAGIPGGCDIFFGTQNGDVFTFEIFGGC